MSEGWFRRKRYGWGAQPDGWQGWLVTGIFVGATVWLATATLSGPSRDWPTFLLAYVPMVAVFGIIAWRTTPGGWRWQWGRRREREERDGHDE